MSVILCKFLGMIKCLKEPENHPLVSAKGVRQGEGEG